VSVSRRKEKQSEKCRVESVECRQKLSLSKGLAVLSVHIGGDGVSATQLCQYLLCFIYCTMFLFSIVFIHHVAAKNCSGIQL